MKINKILLAGTMLFAGASMMAQETVTEYTYNPNWYIQGQIGGQETVGESSFGHLFSPNAQIAVGYNFNPYFGLRLAVNAWQSKGWIDVNNANIHSGWKWNYVAPTVDAVVNLSNVFGGYKPNRLVEVDFLAGIGANIGFSNGEAADVNSALLAAHSIGLENLWSGTKARFVGQAGLDLNFNVSKHVAIGLEVMANMLSDGYNSKKAGNPDWYVNGLLGVKYTFGDKYTETTRTVEVPVADPKVIERIIERVVETPAPAPVEEVKAEILRRDVFFRINTATISKDEMNKVTEVAEFLKSHPNAKVEITGYADKGTGTMAINLRLSKQRAQIVANTLKDKFGIPADRMVVKSMGEEAFQPYSDPVDNRVAICVCE
ncbi:MAG: OmpA family protein [Bacteroidales bacterium]|nr:OmpA family protein [Bacteroidales bacterium]